MDVSEVGKPKIIIKEKKNRICATPDGVLDVVYDEVSKNLEGNQVPETLSLSVSFLKGSQKMMSNSFCKSGSHFCHFNCKRISPYITRMGHSVKLLLTCVSLPE